MGELPGLGREDIKRSNQATRPEPSGGFTQHGASSFLFAPYFPCI